MLPKIRTLGITGGIGSGKSFFCNLLLQNKIPVFYCDDEAKFLIRNDCNLKHNLSCLVGQDLYSSEGVLQKHVLAAFLCKGPSYAKQVDCFVHPCVRKAFLDWTKQKKESIVAMECALLFESKFNELVDFSILVSAPFQLRLKRVMERDNISAETALKWMKLQMPEEQKAELADFVVQNGETNTLESQLQQILKKLV